MKHHVYSLWNSECYCSFATSNACGVTILFKRIKYESTSVFLDDNGNYLVLDLSLNSKSLYQLIYMAQVWTGQISMITFFK